MLHESQPCEDSSLPVLFKPLLVNRGALANGEEGKAS